MVEPHFSHNPKGFFCCVCVQVKEKQVLMVELAMVVLILIKRVKMERL
jgi:hypothetical protein